MLNKKALTGTAGAAKEYVEDVFSTYLYSGTSAPQTITNNIDVSGDGGLVWLKSRTADVTAGYDSHFLFDTARGNTVSLSTNTTGANTSGWGNTFFRFRSDGFDTGTGTSGDQQYLNKSGVNYASWTFRKAPKFFDVVTYTGNGVAGRTVAHNLGSVPGMIIVKRTNSTGGWAVYHRSLGATQALELQDTFAAFSATSYWNNTAPTSSVFSVGTDSYVNASGSTYVAYLFAHDAGGFGDAGTDNVISCGSYSGSGAAGNTITLGYEPQFLLIKCTTTPSLGNTNWLLIDVMRGMPVSEASKVLYPNTSGAEATFPQVSPTATGFILRDNDEWLNASGQTYIYMAIRRPMKTPTSGTEVFKATVFTGVDATQTSGFPVDLVMGVQDLSGSTIDHLWVDRLRGNSKVLITNETSAESTLSDGLWDSNTQVRLSSQGNSWRRLYPMFRRARGFMDIVCYTGTGSARTVTHNLGVAPELMIVKSRGIAGTDWQIYSAPLGATKRLEFTNGGPSTSITLWNNTEPTSSVFTVGTSNRTNESGDKFVAYLFATLAGVSKVGSYTGNGSSQTINCGFSAGARFVIIKRTDSTGDWYVFDTARGIVSGNDPFYFLNSNAVEVTSRDAVDPDNSGFIVNNDATNFPINVNAATYIFYAVA